MDYQYYKEQFWKRNRFRDVYMDFNEKRKVNGLVHHNLIKISQHEPCFISFGWFMIFTLLTVCEFYKLYINTFFIYQEFKIRKRENERKSILDYLNVKESYLHFSLSIKEPKLKKSLNLENIYGFLEVPSQTGSPNPIIAIVAHYDSLGIISDLPQGINSNGSGIIALLELIRIISKIYENYETVIKYDILFVLTSAGNENFKGTETFINNLEPSVSENLQYVLCLDSIGSLNEKDNLFLHLSRYPREYEMTPNKLYNIFNITAKNMGINLNYIKKKVFLSEDFVPWEHEQFSKRKIISATLSTLKAPPEGIFTRNLFTDTDMDLNTVSKNIKFIVEALLDFLFDYDNTKFTIFKDDYYAI